MSLNVMVYIWFRMGSCVILCRDRQGLGALVLGSAMLLLVVLQRNDDMVSCTSFESKALLCRVSGKISNLLHGRKATDPTPVIQV